MAFSKPELELIDIVVGGLCRKLNQPKIKELSIEYRIEKHDVIIYEKRPAWDKPSEMIETPAAKFKFNQTKNVWRLYWMRPGDQGFQYYLAHKGGGIGQPGDDFGNFIRKDSSYFDPFLWENGKRVRKEGYCSDIFTDQAISYIEEHVKEEKKEPFFLYLSFNAPHTPLQLPEKYLEEYKDMEYSAEDFSIQGENLKRMSKRDLESAR